MADYGQLDEFLEPYDIGFGFKGERYEFKIDAETALNFHKFWASKTKATEADIWDSAAKLIGGGFNKKDYRFTGKVHELQEAGMDIALIDKILTAIYIQFRWNNADLAQEYVVQGSVGKAQQVLDKRTEVANLETPKVPGETSTDD